MRAMRIGVIVADVAIVDRSIVMEEIPAVNVVNKSIPIVINSVAGNLARIRPDVRLQVRMIYVNAFVNHSDDHVAAPCSRVPCGLGVDVRARSAATLPGVLE